MKLRLPGWLSSLNYFALWAVLCILGARARAEQLPLDRAIRLALAHSTTSAMAHADVQRTIASYRELRDNYIPQVAVGSGLGWTYGFPLTIEGAAPSLVTVVAQSSVFNPAQRKYLSAAKTEIQVSELQDKDQRNAVIQDVAVSYAELAKWETRLTRLERDQAEAEKLEQAVSARVQEGVDSAVDLKRARLTGARVRLHLAEAHGNADVLRRHLSDLTGLPVSAIEIVPESIPGLPPLQSRDDVPDKAAAANPTVKIANQRALVEALRASAEHRALLPSIDFSAQYARLATFNNYDVYYRSFQPDNATIGVAIRLPLFNMTQRARAAAADSEALKAKKQAESTRDQVSEETLKLERSAEQSEAARDVAQLEYELAQSALGAVQTRIEARTSTLHELADAQTQVNERYLAYQDANFEYERARLNLLRATGDLEKWALAEQSSK